MKKLLYIGLIMAALVGAYAVAAVAADAPAEDVEIAYPGDGAKFPPVMFSHTAHGDLKCEDCHHMMGESDDMGCISCHSNLEDKKAKDSFDVAWHDRKSPHSCVGCHTKMKAGPTKCPECHQK
jgi:predicted CxxxxCH...CXXCH cytochrome family protein